MLAAVPSWRPRATIESFCAETFWPIEVVTTACADSWIAITHCSSAVSGWLLRAGPETTRSIASSSVAWSISAPPSRTVSSAASLITLASSAPLKPEVSLAICSSEASGRQRPLAAVQAEDFEAAVDVGHVDGHLTVEAARPQQRRVEDVGPVGRGEHDEAGVAAEAVHLDQQLRSASARARRCPGRRPAPRLRPAASSSSMKISAGAILRALSKRSRTRAAPTPTSDSTKSEPESEKKAASASPAVAFASSVLPVPGGPTSSTPFGARAPTVAYWPGSAR